MQAVNLGELFRQSIRLAMFIDLVSHHAPQFRVVDINLRESVTVLATFKEVGKDAKPVCIQRRVEAGVWEDGRSPLHRMDFGHDRRVY